MINDEPQIYLRFKKRFALKNVEDSIEDLTGKLSIKEFQNSAIIPRGQIINIQQYKNQYTVIDDIDYCSDIVSDEPSRIEKTTVLYGGYFRHQWGHFLLNSTARLWWIYENKHNLDSVDKIIFIATPGESDIIDANYKEFFELLGIYEKIEIISGQKSYQKIIVPDISFEHDRFYAREMNRVFERIKENSTIDNLTENPNEYKKIFLTRSKLPGAIHKEFNLVHFDRLWEENGFTVIAPEKISLKKLVRILNQAKTIVSVSGSTAHNLVFASSEASVIIMERVAAINDFQIGISKMMEQNVTYIDSFLYPVIPIPTGNVFYYYPTILFQNFINDNNLKYFDDKQLEKINRSKNIFKFFHSYKKQSGHYWGIDNNAYTFEAIAEAYLETADIYGIEMKSGSYFKFIIKNGLSRIKKFFR